MPWGAVDSAGNPLTYTKQKETLRPQSFFKKALRFIFLSPDSSHSEKGISTFSFINKVHKEHLSQNEKKDHVMRYFSYLLAFLAGTALSFEGGIYSEKQ